MKAGALTSEHNDNVREGLVVVQYGRQAEIEDSQTGVIVKCKQRANLPIVVAGDRILWRGKLADDLDEQASIVNATQTVIESLLPRSTVIQRPDKYGKMRTLAANVECMFITVAPKPEPFFNLIDRYIVAAYHCKVEPHILINKSDLLSQLDQRDELAGANLSSDLEVENNPRTEDLNAIDESLYKDVAERLAAVKSFYPSIGIAVTEVSSKNMDMSNPLVRDIEEQRAIFVGQSGVGKSSLIKALAPPDAEDIAVGSLSDARDKGRHTTSFSRLYHLVNRASCIDSPGIREFGLWHMSEGDVIRAFPDIEELAQGCKFRDCRHIKEPGCAIQTRIEVDAFLRLRFDSYRSILNSLGDVDIQQPGL